MNALIPVFQNSRELSVLILALKTATIIFYFVKLTGNLQFSVIQFAWKEVGVIEFVRNVLLIMRDITGKSLRIIKQNMPN
jgi:hypothetical protein